MGLFGKGPGDLLLDALADVVKDGGYSGRNRIGILGNAEKKRETRELISEAKRYINEGEEIYEKAYDKVTSYAAKTEDKLKQHAEYKQKLARELGSNVGNTLKRFSKFDIDSKVIKAPTVSIKSGGVDINIFNSVMSNFVPRTDTLSIFDLFTSDNDYYEAKRQRDEAKRYKEKMKLEKKRLYGYKKQMEEIQRFIIAERSELDSLMEKVSIMTEELNSGMKKSRFSQRNT